MVLYLVGLNCFVDYTFDNINIYGCKVANYQRATGGVVGEVIEVKVEAKSGKESVEVGATIKVKADAPAYAYAVDELGNTVRLDSTYDAENGEVAVLISDMKYSPVGSAAPNVLITQYSTDVSKILGKFGKSVSLVCATSDYLDRTGHSITERSPYYFFIMGNSNAVAEVRDGISTLLKANERFVDNIESGFNYGAPKYSFGIPNKCFQLDDKEPTFIQYEESDGIDTCTVKLKVDLMVYF